MINKTIPVTIHNNLLRFCDTDKEFELQDFLKLIIIKNYNVDIDNSQDRKLKYEFAKEMCFDEKALGNRSTGDKSLIRLLKSPAIMAGSLKESITT